MPPKQTEIRQIQAAEGRLQCLKLRKAGASYRTIAKQLGISERKVKQNIEQGLAHLIEQQIEPADQIRARLLERIHAAQASIADKVNAGNLSAIDRWIKLNAQEADLYGLKAGKTDNKERPVQVIIEYVIPGKVADGRVRADQDQAGTASPSE